MEVSGVVGHALANPDLALECLDAANAQDSLMDYIRFMWPVLEPDNVFMEGEVVRVIAEHLEAVAKGKIRRLLINVPPGPGWVHNRVFTSNGPKELCQIKVGDRVLTHKSRFCEVTQTHGIKTCQTVKVRTRANRSFVCTSDHLILTSAGWKEAGELENRDILKIPVPPDLEKDFIGEDEARLLGYLVGDGSLTHDMPTLTSADEEILKDAQEIALSLGIKTSVQRYEGISPRVSFLGGKKTRDWFEKYGLQGKSSYTKRVPDVVLCSSNKVVRAFLGGYWSADGTVAVRQTRQRGSIYRTNVTTVSEQLAVDTQELLTRLGIKSHFRYRSRKQETKAQPGGVYKFFAVEIHNELDAALMADCPIVKRKRDILKKCRRRFPVSFIEDTVEEVTDYGEQEVTCITVDTDHSLTWSGIAVTNCMKSLGTNVFFPSWVWGPHLNPASRFISWSYAESLTMRDNRKTRNLIISDRYQKYWKDRFKLTSDQNAKILFENDKTGFKQALGIRGVGTGPRGRFLIIDDPHNVKEAESDLIRNDALKFFAETLPTRVEDKGAAIIVIMQRVHEQDISGLILSELRDRWDHLCLPMEYEPDHPFLSNTSLGFKDWRTKPGELLWPERFAAEQVEEIKAQLRSWGGEYGVAGQLQQRPVPRGGGLFKRDWLPIVDKAPEGGWLCRGWDLAASRDGHAAFTVGLKVLKHPEYGFFVLDEVRGQWSPGEVDMNVKHCAKEDGFDCVQSLPQDPGQAGKSQKRYLANLLSGFNLHFSLESGSKEDRAKPLAAQAEAGNVHLVRGHWNEGFIKEFTTFPNSTFKDRVDAGSRAFSYLTLNIDDDTGGCPVAF